jgi:hypothetical protein
LLNDDRPRLSACRDILDFLIANAVSDQMKALIFLEHGKALNTNKSGVEHRVALEDERPIIHSTEIFDPKRDESNPVF